MDNGGVQVVQRLREHFNLRPGQDDSAAGGAGRSTELRATVSPLRLLLRRHRLVPVKRRYIKKRKPLKYSLSKAFAEWKKKKV